MKTYAIWAHRSANRAKPQPWRMMLSLLTSLPLLAPSATGAELQVLSNAISDQQVAQFARLAIDNIPREFPNKPSHVMVDAASVQRPRELHPVFFGCFDWHSSVHGHWMLARLAKVRPNAKVVTEICQLLDEQLTAEKLAKEAAYFDTKSNRSFERMYGWAWTLRLATELHTWDAPDARRWAANLAPLEQRIVALTKGYLPRLTYPIRTGVHPDTAFALSQVLDYARTVNDEDLTKLVVQYSREKYLDDRDYPSRFEPSGQDFFSQAWNEADLMRRVMGPKRFAQWLDQFLPALADPNSDAAVLLKPAVVSDPSDPKIVHLAGLNLSRAWTQQGVLSALPNDDPRRPAIEQSIAVHTKAGLDYVFSGHYEGEHWLATFAVYLLTGAGY
ncbi:MAG: DUF2891 domain-containing protein [Pirellulales bacterium]|nr:DUF2891 domain-containing protein [Pirellulales bacterium]